jgi:hypothetical protein
MDRSTPRVLVAVALAAALAACSSDAFTPTTPIGATEAPEAALNVVQVAPSEAPPETTVVSFVAKKGKSFEQKLYLSDTTGAPSFDAHGHGHADDDNGGHGSDHHGKEYLRLTLSKNSLLARPDGTPFANNDTVTITIRVLDPARMLFQFEPAGLTFSPSDPAEIRINYDVANGDLDHNGHHDAADDSLEDHLGIWVQETPGAPFTRLNSLVSKGDKDIRADIPGFSRYAVSY